MLCLNEIGFGENHVRPLWACTAAGLDLGSFLLTQLLFEDLLEVGLILPVHFFVLWVRFCAHHVWLECPGARAELSIRRYLLHPTLVLCECQHTEHNRR